MNKYRRQTTQDKVLNFIKRGITGIGLLVVLLSLTQGLNGIIGTVLMIVLVSAFASSIMWLGGALESLYNSRRAK